MQIKRRQEGENKSEPQAEGESKPSAQQNFETLPRPPPLPIIEIARDFIKDQAGIEDDSTYITRVLESSNATVLPNETIVTNTTLDTRDLLSPAYVIEPLTGRKVFGVSDISPGFLDFATLPEMKAMAKRQSQKRQCDASTPCPDGSCCNKSGRCGFGKENCGDGCLSNCESFRRHNKGLTDCFLGNAKAFCGKDSEGGNSKCPLNVCCSFYGYCGVGAKSNPTSHYLLSKQIRLRQNSVLEMVLHNLANPAWEAVKSKQLLHAVVHRPPVAVSAITVSVLNVHSKHERSNCERTRTLTD